MYHSSHMRLQFLPCSATGSSVSPAVRFIALYSPLGLVWAGICKPPPPPPGCTGRAVAPPIPAPAPPPPARSGSRDAAAPPLARWARWARWGGAAAAAGSRPGPWAVGVVGWGGMGWGWEVAAFACSCHGPCLVRGRAVEFRLLEAGRSLRLHPCPLPYGIGSTAPVRRQRDSGVAAMTSTLQRRPQQPPT